MLLLTLATCSAALGSTAPVVKIGLVAPFEGRYRQVGYDVIYAARLAVRERNAAGGVGGYRIELVALDDSGDPAAAVRAAQTLAVDPMVMGAVGHWRDETTAAARPVYHEAELAFLEMDPNSQAETTAPADFSDRYQAVTPFDEAPGPLAWAAYEQIDRLIQAIGEAASSGGREPTRAAVEQALGATQSD